MTYFGRPAKTITLHVAYNYIHVVLCVYNKKTIKILKFHEKVLIISITGLLVL